MHGRPSHWALEVHFEKQVLVAVSHPKGAQNVVVPALQAPPVQTIVPTTALPWQRPAVHMVPSGYRRQAPLPSQSPSKPQVVTASALHWPWTTGGRPLGTGEHVPMLPARLQAIHGPVQALLQHTPSTQFPVPHSS